MTAEINTELWRNTKWYFVLVEELVDNTLSTKSASKWLRTDIIGVKRGSYFEVMWRFISGILKEKTSEFQVFRHTCLL